MAKPKQKPTRPYASKSGDDTPQHFESSDLSAVPDADFDKPLDLVEDAETGDRYVMFSTPNGNDLQCIFDDQEPWVTRKQIAELFGKSVQRIGIHIKNILDDGELESEGNVRKAYIADSAKPVETYGLDMVLSVGYRVRATKQAITYRRWSNQILRQYLIKGYAIDAPRLKGKPDRFTELRDIIRDIRMDEANVYAELRRICSLCADYDPASDAAHVFYAHMQAKLYWAVVSNTPSEMLLHRVHADSKDLGLQTWAGDRILQADALVAKNTLTPSELKELNRVHDILLSVFEDQLDIGRLTTMDDAKRLLDEQLAQLRRPVLRHGGSVSSADAKAHAKAQYKIFDDRRKIARKANADAELAEIKRMGKSISRTSIKSMSKKG